VNYQKVLKRSWNMVWRYRALWIFGTILALTTINGFYFALDPGWESSGERIAVRVNETSIVYLPGPDLTVDLTDPKHLIRQIDDDDLEELRRFFSGELTAGWIPRGVRAALIAFGVVAASIAVVGLVARYVAEASLIRMVHEGEETGEKPGILRGARLGFSRSAWRLFLIDILINLPLMLVFLLAFMLALSPLLLWVAGSTAAGVTGAFLTAGSLFLLSILSILVSAVVSMFVQVIRRACAVEGLGVFASIGRGLYLSHRRPRITRNRSAKRVVRRSARCDARTRRSPTAGQPEGVAPGHTGVCAKSGQAIGARQYCSACAGGAAASHCAAT